MVICTYIGTRFYLTGFCQIDRLEAFIDDVIYSFDAQVVRCELDFS
jgi:hypothetical protein